MSSGGQRPYWSIGERSKILQLSTKGQKIYVDKFFWIIQDVKTTASGKSEDFREHWLCTDPRKERSQFADEGMNTKEFWLMREGEETAELPIIHYVMLQGLKVIKEVIYSKRKDTLSEG